MKPELWDSEKLGRLDVAARLTFVGLISLADDEGRGRGETRWLLGHLHPYATDVNEESLLNALEALERAALVAFYTVAGCRYYALPGWSSHQKIDRPNPSTLPAVPADHPLRGLFDDHSSNDRRTIDDQSSGEGKGRDQDRKGSGSGRDHGARAPFVPPSVEEVEAYTAERAKEGHPRVDARRFVDHYEARGWKPKGYTTVMKDWKAAVRTWERYDGGTGSQAKRVVGGAAPVRGKYDAL